MTVAAAAEQDARRKRTVVWVLALVTVGMMFDGYDLVVYGAVVSTFLKDPSQIGQVTPAIAGTLGSYALLGMLFGALLAGAFGDIVGRKGGTGTSGDELGGAGTPAQVCTPARVVETAVYQATHSRPWSPADHPATDIVTDLAVVRTERTNPPVPEYRVELPQQGRRSWRSAARSGSRAP